MVFAGRERNHPKGKTLNGSKIDEIQKVLSPPR
jgi:hypothetical protein